MSGKIEAVVFDFGGVLSLQPEEHHLEDLLRLSGLDRPTFDREYRRQRPEYDRGAIDGREYWSRVLDSRGGTAGEEVIRSLSEQDRTSWTRINREVLRWARRLQEAGVRTGILSNMPRDILEWIRGHYRWIEDFEVGIFSCIVGINKPDPRIYSVCLNAFGLSPSRLLFLDDSVENVEGAGRAGFRAVLFSSLQDALQRIGANQWLAENLLAAKGGD
jgi:putative hydrolase of the HAD superfamily